MKLKFYFFVTFFLLLFITTYSQCENAGFEEGNFNNWTGYTGTCCPITTNIPGIVLGQHTIMTGNGIDPNSCIPITVVPPGATYSARLGNSDTGAQAERLQYTFSITPQSNLIVFEYAIILQDPGHSPEEQPRFEAQLLDSSNNPIPCTFYQVSAAQNADGFTTCENFADPLLVKNWTTIGIDASAYVGQNLTLDFATGDCSIGGHYGYAYIHASCGSLKLNARSCLNSPDNVVITAPPGFASYLWNTGEITQSITVNGNPDSLNVSCHITSVTGCSFDLQAEFQFALVQAHFTTEQNCFSDVQISNTSLFTNGEEGNTTWTIDNGLSLTGNPFHAILSGPGNYLVSMIAFNEIGCADTLSEIVTVVANPSISLSTPPVLNCTNSTASASIAFEPGYASITSLFSSGNLSSDFHLITTTQSDWIGASAYDSISHCTVSDSVFVESDLNYPLIITTPQDTLNCARSFLEIQGIQLICDGGYSYTWSTSNGNIIDALQTLHPKVDAVGTYSITVTDQSSGCSSTADISVEEDDHLRIHLERIILPNIITLSDPDGRNDCWEVILPNSNYSFYELVGSYQFKLYNRWGDLIYESDRPEKYCPNSNDLVPGTYYFLLQFEAICQNQQTFEFSGNIEVK